MIRRAIVALLLGLTVVSLSLAGTPTNQFTISMSGRYLAVSKGKVYFGRAVEGRFWSVLGTRIKSESPGGGYLAYDPEGKTNLVGLESKPGKGTEWNIDVPGRGRGSEGKRGVIRAAHGPKKGWYLTVADGSLVLVANPPQKLEVERWWDHKYRGEPGALATGGASSGR